MKVAIKLPREWEFCCWCQSGEDVAMWERTVSIGVLVGVNWPIIITVIGEFSPWANSISMLMEEPPVGGRRDAEQQFLWSTECQHLHRAVGWDLKFKLPRIPPKKVIYIDICKPPQILKDSSRRRAHKGMFSSPNFHQPSNQLVQP